LHIIYVDESGDDGFPANNIFLPNNTPSNKFIRTGLIIHDWKWKRINDTIADFKFGKRIPQNVEIHATEIRRGKKKITDSRTRRRREVSNWYGQQFPNTSDRMNLLKDCCMLINSLEDITLIFIVIDKTRIDTAIPGYRNIPKENSWEYLIERYNLFLNNKTDQVGIIISDAVEHNIEKTHREFARAIYTQSSHVKEFHFIESIMFEPSESSNLLQLVDVASYACFRKFNSNDSSLYDQLKDRIMKNSQGLIDGAGLKIWPSQ
jgi:hypothetical protein